MLIMTLKELGFLLCCLCVYLVMYDHAQGKPIAVSLKERGLQCFANPTIFGVIQLIIVVLVGYFIYSLVWGK